MPFQTPITFVSGDALQAADLREQYESVRTQYHNVPQDLLIAGAFVDVQHIQPPRSSPIEGVLMHGVSGLLGAQSPGAPFGRVSFSSSEIGNFHHLTNTSFAFVPRNSCNLMLHWWAEVIAGPDASPNSLDESRYCWVVPYRGAPDSTFSYEGQECVNNYEGWSASGAAKGAAAPYERIGASFLSGTYPVRNAPAGQELRVGLSAFSGVGRAVIVNYGVVLEAYYI
jgi:hypothetical protein